MKDYSNLIGKKIKLTRVGGGGLANGNQGIVQSINRAESLGFQQIDVKWEDGSTLFMLPESGDRWKEI